MSKEENDIKTMALQEQDQQISTMKEEISQLQQTTLVTNKALKKERNKNSLFPED